MLTLENRGIPIAKIVDSKHYPKKNGKSKFLALIPEEDINIWNRFKLTIHHNYLLS